MWTKSYFFPWTLSRLGIFFFLFYFFTKINVKFIYILTKPGKTADIWRRYHWFPRQMTSEKRAQKFHSDDASLRRSGVISMEFLPSFLRRHLAGKPGVASPNVGCVLRLVCSQLTLSWPCFLFRNALSIIVHMVRMQVLRGRRGIAFG